MLKNLLPRTCWTTYGHVNGAGEIDGQRLAIWRQWRGHVWDHTVIKVG